MKMTIHEAAAVLATELIHVGLAKDYFAVEKKAQQIADAMSLATGSCWIVQLVPQHKPIWIVRRMGQ